VKSIPGEVNMATSSFNPFKSLDRYFLICKVVTLIFCLPWPLTLLASVMSLAGYIPPNTPMFEVALIRLAWLLALVYPVVFLAVVLFAERVLSHRHYGLAAVVALLPAGFSLFFVLMFVLT
jgi:hypothetical protein